MFTCQNQNSNKYYIQLCTSDNSSVIMWLEDMGYRYIIRYSHDYFKIGN